MKANRLGSLVVVVAILGGVSNVRAAPLGTGFTYQGQLKQDGSPANGLYDLRFRLYDASAGGAQVGTALCANDVSVTNGLFTVPLDFGSQFNGDQRFLEVEVRGDMGLDCANLAGFVILAPRQPLTAAPHALFSLNADQLDGLDSTAFLQLQNATPGTPQSGHFNISGTSLIGGNIGIGTITPAARLAVRGDGTDVLLGSGGCGAPTAAIGFGTMSGCTDFALGGNVNAGADAGTFLNRPTGRSLHFRENNGADQMTIVPGGSVGIGTTAPGAKLDVIAAEPFGIFGRNSAANSIGVFGQSTGADGTGVLGRYDGPASNSGWGVFGFSPNGFAGVFGSGGKNGVFGRTSSANDSGVFGKNDGVGAGVTGVGITGDGVFGTSNKNGVHGRTGSASDSGVWGENTGTGYGTAGSSVNGVGVVGDSTNGFAMQARGNTVQSRDNGGWVKAMAFVEPFAPGANKIIRCYNSQATGSTVSTPPCGFSYSSPALGTEIIDFGFRVDDRFISVTPVCDSGGTCTTRSVVMNAYAAGSNAWGFVIRYNDNNNVTNNPFLIIVY